MTRRERIERKIALRKEWAEKRRAEADARYDAAGKILSHIPLGQPILIGHHSERRHRGDLALVDTNMRKCSESITMAKHHDSKAAGLESQLKTCIFSDDEDATEKLQEKIGGLEKQRERNNAVNKIIRAKPKNQPTPEKIAALAAIGVGESLAGKLFEPDFCGRVGIPSYVNQNLSANIARLKGRLASIANNAERKTAAVNAGGVAIEGDSWIRVTFAEKPPRDVINRLKAAGFRWGGGSWIGSRDKLPDLGE